MQLKFDEFLYELYFEHYDKNHKLFFHLLITPKAFNFEKLKLKKKKKKLRTQLSPIPFKSFSKAKQKDNTDKKISSSLLMEFIFCLWVKKKLFGLIGLKEVDVGFLIEKVVKFIYNSFFLTNSKFV